MQVFEPIKQEVIFFILCISKAFVDILANKILSQTSTTFTSNSVKQFRSVQFQSMTTNHSICSEILNTIPCFFLALILLFMQLFPNILSGMANSANPDETAP